MAAARKRRPDAALARPRAQEVDAPPDRGTSIRCIVIHAEGDSGAIVDAVRAALAVAGVRP